MRKFVVSDLYGDREILHIILSYLENISLEEDVLLIINGNLILGKDFQIIEDIYERETSLSIQYLGGDKELEVYQRLPKESEWSSFLGGLDTFYACSESIFHRPIMIAHGNVPKSIIYSTKIRDNDSMVFDTVRRELDLIDFHYSSRRFRGVLGRNGFKNSSYFLIKGGTPIHNNCGFFYNGYEHYLVIDGGCRNYLYGDDSYDHVPLIEIMDDRIEILTFNHKNEITNGFLFNGNMKSLSEEELNHKRRYLENTFLDSKEKVKELRK